MNMVTVLILAELNRTKVTIDGKGHSIDAKGKARVFNVQASDVTIINLIIKNANYNGDVEKFTLTNQVVR